MPDVKQRPLVLVIMGVTGVGKTTVGQALADALGWRFFDADDFHPEANVRKMHGGTPLDDDDRLPWLEALNRRIRQSLVQHEPAVLACSALKATYRGLLQRGNEEGVQFIFLEASPDVIERRLKDRTGHFMNPALLASQFETLEVPANALRIDAASTPEEIVAAIRAALGL